MCAEPARLSYDVVMATRNRTDAVALSLPLLVAQTRPPVQIVVVDSSDDQAPIAAIVADVAETAPMPVRLVRAAAGLTHQRNVGLTYCAADVVMFPDDDSLYHPETAAEIMEIYEVDTAGAIAGVAGRPAETPPSEVSAKLGRFEAETRGGRLRRALRDVRQATKEAAWTIHPFLATSRALSKRFEKPHWLAAEEAIMVPYLTGFRMSFRRDVIAGIGFDETLRRYGWFEDIDASFGAARHGLLVTANRAPIYHHRAAEKRDRGHMMGLWAILNRTYVVMKAVHANPDLFPDPAWEIRRLRWYSVARAAVYRLMARDTYGRDRARGARDGLARQARLTAAAPEELPAVYRDLVGE